MQYHSTQDRKNVKFFFSSCFHCDIYTGYIIVNKVQLYSAEKSRWTSSTCQVVSSGSGKSSRVTQMVRLFKNVTLQPLVQMFFRLERAILVVYFGF